MECYVYVCAFLVYMCVNMSMQEADFHHFAAGMEIQHQMPCVNTSLCAHKVKKVELQMHSEACSSGRY